MTDEPLIAFANAFAGVYAATIWGFFTIMRLNSRQWWWAVLDVAMFASAVVVALAYWLVATDPPRIVPWFELLRLLVVPILVLPTIVHLALWRQTREFLHRADEVDDELE